MSRTSLQYTARGCSTIQECFIKVLDFAFGGLGGFVAWVFWLFFFPR